MLGRLLYAKYFLPSSFCFLHPPKKFQRGTGLAPTKPPGVRALEPTKEQNAAEPAEPAEPADEETESSNDTGDSTVEQQSYWYRRLAGGCALPVPAEEETT